VVTTDHNVTQIERKIDEVHDYMQHGSGHTVTSQTTDANLSARRDSYTRDQNVVVFGVSETSDWQKQLSDVLNFAAGRCVAVQDAFRIGRSAAGKQRQFL